MIIKKRSLSYSYIGLQLLDQRLPEDHNMKELIHSKMNMAKAGIHGEMKMDEVFSKYSFPFDYVVLHDVSLKSNGIFQIDTLFITQFFAVILESKNISGKLSFKQNPLQLQRVNEENNVDFMESPEVQVERNKYMLEEWLSAQGVTIPVYGAIVLTNANAMVIEPSSKFPTLLHKTIPNYLRNIERLNKYLHANEMYALAKKIVEKNQLYFPYPMCRRWGIDPEDLLTGVRCEKCHKLGMAKRKGGWHCLQCNYVDRLAHEKAIKEWFILIGDSMNNRQCRYFLQLQSHHTASRLLRSMKLEKIGTSRNTLKYIWKW